MLERNVTSWANDLKVSANYTHLSYSLKYSGSFMLGKFVVKLELVTVCG